MLLTTQWKSLKLHFHSFTPHTSSLTFDYITLKLDLLDALRDLKSFKIFLIIRGLKFSMYLRMES